MDVYFVSLVGLVVVGCLVVYLLRRGGKEAGNEPGSDFEILE